MLTRAQKLLYRAQGYVPTQLNGEEFRGDPHHSKFWRDVAAGRWEPHTFSVLDRYLDAGADYLDLGAWIGPTVLYAARRARHVWAFEPDATAFRALNWNLELNGIENVSALPVALSQSVGVARMASFRGEPGDSMSSLLNPGGPSARDVVTLGWSDFAATADLSAVSLVKMDIEGAEFDVLPHLLDWLKSVRPALYLSTHAPYLDAELRRDRMADLAECLSFYPNWRDSQMQMIGPDRLVEAPALHGFPNYLLTA